MYTYSVKVSRYSDEDEYLFSYFMEVAADDLDDLHFHMEHVLAVCEKWEIAGKRTN